MSETPKERASRRIAGYLREYCFNYQATVFLANLNEEDNIKQINIIKRMIQKDNPETFIMCFVSQSINKETGEIEPYICFYSYDRLVGVSVLEKQEEYQYRVVGERPNVRRKLISRRLGSKRILGAAEKIRQEGVFDLTIHFGEKKFKRYSFLNSAHKPNEKALKSLQEEILD